MLVKFAQTFDSTFHGEHMIKPTVGRTVNYWPARADLGQPNAAIIAYVHSDTQINIAAFDANGNHTSITNVHLHQEGEERPSGGFAEWMPYQREQAAKTAGFTAEQVQSAQQAAEALAVKDIDTAQHVAEEVTTAPATESLL
jgi:hypothetical protein